LNARIGNAENYNIVESFGEPVISTVGLKQRDFATCNNIKIVNSYYQHKNVHTYPWSANNSRTFRDYFVANRKLSELFLDMGFRAEVIVVQITFDFDKIKIFTNMSSFMYLCV